VSGGNVCGVSKLQSRQRNVANSPVRAIRLAASETQSDLAEYLGCTPSFVSLVETGRAKMGVDSSLRFLRHYRQEMAQLGVELEDVLRGEMPTRRTINARKRRNI
jgi:transcriptional regulator with XRE-family HTH domain